MSPAQRPAPESYVRAEALFRKHGGTLRMSEVLRLGVLPKVLYGMRDAGLLDVLSRGVYRLKALEPLGKPDLVTVAARIPQGVICLVSALDFHGLTTQVPHAVDVALRSGSTSRPRLDHPPLRVFWFSGPAFQEGIETHALSGRQVRIYSPEKTLADCFRFRNKIGTDVAIEALRLWHARRRRHLPALLQHARHCRVERVMRPYLEALA